MKTRMAVIALMMVLLAAGPTGRAQRNNRKTRDTSQQSVVMLRKTAADSAMRMDSSLIMPEKPRRPMKVRLVPAAPPGRSRQQILFSDSLGKGGY